MCSQSPNVALALSASWEQLVLLAAANRLAAALPRAVERAETGRAELETTVGSAADTLSLHRVTSCRMLAARAGLQALVVEERFGHLGGQIKEVNRPTAADVYFHRPRPLTRLDKFILFAAAAAAA